MLIKEHFSHKPNLNPQLILQEMEKKGLTPDITTYNTLLHICLENRNYAQTENLLSSVRDVLSPVHPDIITFNIILKGEGLKLSD